VLAVAITVAVDAVRGGGDRAPGSEPAPAHRSVRGPDVPQPDALPGTLTVLTTDGCRLQTLDLRSLTLGAPGPETSCDLWPSPNGKRALVSRDRRGGAYELWLAQLGEAPRLLRRLGIARGDPSWSPDGRRAAWCTSSGRSQVLELASGRTITIAGCRPRVLTDGSVLTLSGGAGSSLLLRNGLPLLPRRALLTGFGAPEPESVDVLGFDQRDDGLLALAVAGIGDERPSIVLELWRGTTFQSATPLPLRVVPGAGALGELLRFSPSGEELAVGFARSTFGVMVLDVSSRQVVREPTTARGFAWSPDGRWLAIATRERIEVSGALRAETAYVIPLAGSALAWSQ
jgi:hypothetical protein